MVTVTRGEIIELNVRIETRMVKISLFACFCSSSDSRITIFNHYIVRKLIRIWKRLERLQANIKTANNLQVAQISSILYTTYAYAVKFRFAYWHMLDQ